MSGTDVIFFDLDHTLWDFDRNSRETLHELFIDFKLWDQGIGDPEAFINEYIRINHEMWNGYHTGTVQKSELRVGRFMKALQTQGVSDDMLANNMSEAYLERCPDKKHLFPGATETLSYLRTKYSLHLITNGFKETQFRKLNGSGLAHYFDGIHISEVVGFNKPHKGIFDHAVLSASTSPSKCVMVGDNLEADIKGAMNSGIKAILFDPENKSISGYAHTTISHLEQLTLIL